MVGKSFRGMFTHTIDKKNRVSIPMKFRKIIGENQDLVISIPFTDEKGFLLMSEEYYEEMYGTFDDLPITDNDLKRLFIHMNSYTSDCSIDSSGRILIPESIMGKFEIKDEVVIVGMKKYIQIFAKEEYFNTSEEFDKETSINKFNKVKYKEKENDLLP